MDAAVEKRVVIEVKNRVCYVTITRPEARNALTKSMYAAIRDACVSADRNPDVDVLVLRGSNGSFASGGDLKEILEVLEGDDPTSICNYEEHLPFETVKSISKPSIACIDGLCIGGGLTLSLMCDIRIASDRSRFAIPEAKVGIVDGHLPRFLRDVVPHGKLRYWMYTGAIFPASEAYAFGLLTEVVPAESLDDWVAKCAADLKSSSLSAMQTIKRILNETHPLSMMTDAYLTMLQPDVLERLKKFRDR